MFNIIGYNILWNCLKMIYVINKTDIQLKKLLETTLNSNDFIAEEAVIYFYNLPDEIKDDYYDFKHGDLSNKIIFQYANNKIAVDKAIGADSIANFCMRHAENKETLRPLYNQIREKFNITYPHIV